MPNPTTFTPPLGSVGTIFLPAVFKRSASGHFFEQVREVGRIAQTARFADADSRQVRLQKHLLGLFKPIVAQIFAGRHVRLHLEEGEEPGTRVADVIDQFVQIDAR